MEVEYENCFDGKPKDDPILHLKKFNDRCKALKISSTNNNIIKTKVFFSLLTSWKSSRLDIKMTI
jgi:hypothetical protein